MPVQTRAKRFPSRVPRLFSECSKQNGEIPTRDDLKKPRKSSRPQPDTSSRALDQELLQNRSKNVSFEDRSRCTLKIPQDIKDLKKPPLPNHRELAVKTMSDREPHSLL